MERINYSTKRGKYKHLSERERYRLEGYLESRMSVRMIAEKKRGSGQKKRGSGLFC